MANTVKIKNIIEVSGGNLVEPLESFQGNTSSGGVEIATEITTVANACKKYRVPFTANAVVVLWDDADSGGTDELAFIWIKSSQGGHIEWLTNDETDEEDVNTCPVAADVPFLMIRALSSTGKLQAFATITDTDGLGGTLSDITKFRFKDASGNAGEVEVILAK